jgi:hypothetical protein
MFTEEACIADIMRAYAQDAEAHVQGTLGVVLHYSEASLEHIDTLLAQRLANGLLHPENMSAAEQEELWVYCKMLGGYLGEVMVRNAGGAWQAKLESNGSLSLNVVIGNAILARPADAIWRRLTGEEDSMTGDYETLLVVLNRGECTGHQPVHK